MKSLDKKAAKKAPSLKEIRLKKRREERRLSISTDVQKIEETFSTVSRVKPELLTKQFAAYRDAYTLLAVQIVAGHFAMNTAINSALEAVRAVNPDTDVAPALFESVDSAWDIATSAIFVEQAFMSAGYKPEEARRFAQALILKQQSEPIKVTDKPEKLKKVPATTEEMVDAVRDELKRIGLTRSKAAPQVQEAPVRRRKQQVEQ